MSAIRVRICFLLLICLLGWADRANAQLPQPLADPSLDLRGQNSGRKVAVTPDGGAIISHDGRWVGGDLERPRLFRMRADGSVDAGWQVEPNSIVWDIAVNGDEVYLAGSFSAINGQPRRGLARVSLSSGTLSDWNPNNGSNSNYTFNSILVQGEAVFIGGNFTQVGTTARTHLARLDRQSGNPDPNFNPSVTSAGSPRIVSIASDGSELFVAGEFAAINGLNRGNAAKLSLTNGTVDANWAPTFNGQILEAVLNDGQFYAVGCFGSVSGVNRNFLARVSTGGVGTLDSTWNPAPNGGCTVGVAVDNAHVYVSGPFTQVGGVSAPRYARIAKTGTGAVDATWQPNVTVFTFGYDAQPLPSGAVIIVGEHTRVQGIYSPGIARVSGTNGSLLSPAIYSENRGNVIALAPAPDGGTYVGGYFQRVGNVQRNGLLRLTPSGQLDTNWNPASGFNGGTIFALRADSSHLYVGGDQNTGSLANLLRISHAGTVDGTWVPAPNGRIFALDIDESTNSILVGGGFGFIGGQGRNRIAEVSRNNALTTDFNPNVTGTEVRSIARVGNDVYLGGFFTAVGGLPRTHLAKVNRSGSVDVGFVANADNTINSLLPGPDGTLYVGGFFSNISGLGRRGFVRLLQSNGTPDPAWNTFLSSGSIQSLAAASDGLYVAGGFSSIGNQPRQNLARLSHAGTVAPLFAPTPDNQVNTALEQGNRVLAGGFMGFSAPTTQTQIGIHAYPRDATPVATTLTITSDQPENTQPHQFYRVEVSALGAGIPLANQRIQIECDSGVFCEAFLDASGNGACELASRAPGTRTLTARWVGSPLFLAATDTEPHTVAGTSATPPANPAFDLRAPAFVSASAPFSDGSLLIAGGFNRIGETPRRGVARLRADGTADPAYSADVIGFVNAVARDATDHAYVIGGFNYIDGVFRRNIAKLSPSGGVVPTWTAATSEVNSSTAYVDGNGDLILQGFTFQVSGSPNFLRTSLFKLSGSSGALMSGFNVEITTLNTNSSPTVRVTGDGTHLYVYGRFDAVNGVPRRNLARLNPNGSVDTAWNPSPNAFVNHLISDGTGGIYLAGEFTEVSGQSAQRLLVRLNASGALTNGFNAAPDSTVQWMVRDGSVLYVSGFFSQIGGLQRFYVVKLDAGSGSADAAFNVSSLVQSGFGAVPSRVERLGSALWAPTSVIFASNTTVQSIGAIRVDALTAAALPVSNLTRQAEVLALARQPDGATLIGGRFARIGGPQRNLVRISPDGQFDDSFAPALNSFASVRALLVRGNGDIYAGGFPLLKLSSAGVIDNAFRAPNSTVLALADAGDGLIAGGGFTTVGSFQSTAGGGSPVLVPLDNDRNGSHSDPLDALPVAVAGPVGPTSITTEAPARPGTATDLTPPAEESFSLRALLTQGFDNVAVAPNAPAADSVCATNLPGWIARNNSTAPRASCVYNPNTTPAPPFTAHAGATNAYAAFNFNNTSAPGASGNTISTWLISPRVTFTANSTLEFWVRAPSSAANPANQAFPDRLQVRVSTAAAGADTDIGTTNTSVGTFTTQILDINPTLVSTGATCPAGGITNPAGGTITGFPVGAWCRISLTSASGLPTTGAGRIAFRYFVTDAGPGGTNSNFIGIDSFAFEDGVVVNPNARNRIAKLNYASGNAIAGWDPNASGTVRSLALGSGGSLYVGGDFATISGQPRQRLARLNADGSLDAAWQPSANSSVETLMVQGTDVYAGGFFSQINGINRGRLAKLSVDDGTLAPWNPGGNTFPIIYALARAQDGGILAGGSFRFMGGAYRSNVAKLDPVTGVADPLWNPSTDAPVRALLAGYGNTPVSIRRPDVEQNIAIGGEFEFMGATPMSGFVAVPAIPVNTEQRVFCSGFEANACVPLP